MTAPGAWDVVLAVRASIVAVGGAIVFAVGIDDGAWWLVAFGIGAPYLASRIVPEDAAHA